MTKTFYCPMEFFESTKWNTDPAQVFTSGLIDQKLLTKLSISPLIQPSDQRLFFETHKWVLENPNVSVSDFESADLIVYPNNFLNQPSGRQFLKRCLENRKHIDGTQKKIVLLCNDDYSDRALYQAGDLIHQFNPENIAFYHPNIARSKKTSVEYALPCFSAVRFHHEGTWHTANTRLSFCGSPYTHPIRFNAVKTLSQNMTRVIPDFIIRDRFHAHADAATRVYNQEEFRVNLSRCTYALCIRGGGNFSYRFCEALACGRVPVVIDTDCDLPMSHIEPFKSLYENPENVVRIPNGEQLIYTPEILLKQVEDAILDHHDRNQEKIAQIHIRNQEVGLRLQPLGFLKTMLSV